MPPSSLSPRHQTTACAPVRSPSSAPAVNPTTHRWWGPGVLLRAITRRCPTCGGDGHVLVLPRSGVAVLEEGRCTPCRGSGLQHALCESCMAPLERRTATLDRGELFCPDCL